MSRMPSANPWYNVHISSLKILASEQTFEAVDRLVTAQWVALRVFEKQ